MGSTEHIIKYTYDAANQLIREDNQQAGYSWAMTYDNAGNSGKTIITGRIEKNEDVFPTWRIVLDTPISVEDWDGKHSCSVLYFYNDTTLNGLPVSSYAGKTVTVEGTPENYRGGG